MSSFLRFTSTLLIAGSLVAACAAGAATVSPSPTATATPTPVPTQVPTPAPTALANGWAQVVMIGPVGLDVSNTGTTDPKTGLITGISVQANIDKMSDPRANGTLSVAETVQADSTGALGYLWATVTLANSGGSWAGPCRGLGWDSGNISIMSCWLTGSGGYAGLTYAYTAKNAGAALTDWSGLIYRGSPPAP